MTVIREVHSPAQIIALPATMLLPAHSLARERGRKTRCVSNVRQMICQSLPYRDDRFQTKAIRGIEDRGKRDPIGASKSSLAKLVGVPVNLSAAGTLKGTNEASARSPFPLRDRTPLPSNPGRRGSLGRPLWRGQFPSNLLKRKFPSNQSHFHSLSPPFPRA